MFFFYLIRPRLLPSAITGIYIGGFTLATLVLSLSGRFKAQTQAQLNSSILKHHVSARVTVAGQVIDLEVAQTNQQKALGLMYRTALADNRGMLFLFSPPRQVEFWMKNLRFPLDIIFMRDGQVEALAHSVPPCQQEPCPTYGAKTEVDQVLKLRGGQALKLRLKAGDRLSVQLFD